MQAHNSSSHKWEMCRLLLYIHRLISIIGHASFPWDIHTRQIQHNMYTNYTAGTLCPWQQQYLDVYMRTDSMDHARGDYLKFQTSTAFRWLSQCSIATHGTVIFYYVFVHCVENYTNTHNFIKHSAYTVHMLGNYKIRPGSKQQGQMKSKLPSSVKPSPSHRYIYIYIYIHAHLHRNPFN